VLLVCTSMLAATGCPKERELPPDPPDMERFEGTKLSVPRPDGYKQVTEVRA